MTPDYLAIGKRLQEARKKSGLTQQALADLMGVSVSYIKSTERGNKPSIQYLFAVAYSCHVSFDWLLIGVYKNQVYIQDDFLQELATITDGLGDEGKAVILGVVRTIVENSLPAREKTLSPLKEEIRISDKNADN
ncbi:MAG: helix-turn-helix domain-containing protein [Acidaminococcales bacterium]|jgi:transcriptional regulator with XRE-family HTH domain|nr:helix-turn-helix domain-containing protein [Acidaminococcales bacterium]